MLAGQSAPIILHQPRPTLHTLFPGQQFAKELARLDERTYVGIIGDSLFAMSHVSYPLVRVDYRFPHTASDDYSTESASSNTDVDLPLVERECTAHGCLVGNHLSRVDSASSRFSRLIEARPPKLLIEGPPLSSPFPPAIGGIPLIRDPYLLSNGELSESPGFWGSYWAQVSVLSISMLLGCITLLIRRRRSTIPAPVPKAGVLAGPLEAASKLPPETTPLSTAASPPILDEQPSSATVKPKTTVAFAESPSKPGEDEAGGDDSEGEGDEGAEGEELKRKKRRRRGRKKGKVDTLVAISNDEPLKSHQSSSEGGSDPSSKQDDFVLVPTPVAVEPPLPSPISVPISSSPSLPPSSSLSVSDVVLGQSALTRMIPTGITIFSPNRLWLVWYHRVQRLFPRPLSRCQTSTPRLRHRRLPRGCAPTRIGRPPECNPILLPGTARYFPVYCTRALSSVIGGYHCAAEHHSIH